MKTQLLFLAALFILSNSICSGQNKLKRKLLNAVTIENMGAEIINAERTLLHTPLIFPPIEPDYSLITQGYCIIIDDVKMRCGWKYVAPQLTNPSIDIQRSPSRNINPLVNLNGGIEPAENRFSIRGSRNEPLAFVDGVKLRGQANLPIAAIESVEIFSGGIPADIGDTGGGVILINTRTIRY